MTNIVIQIDVSSLSILVELAKRAPRFSAEDQWIMSFERRCEKMVNEAILAERSKELASKQESSETPTDNVSQEQISDLPVTAVSQSNGKVKSVVQ